jgi:hypothetical protein
MSSSHKSCDSVRRMLAWATVGRTWLSLSLSVSLKAICVSKSRRKKKILQKRLPVRADRAVCDPFSLDIHLSEMEGTALQCSSQRLRQLFYAGIGS